MSSTTKPPTVPSAPSGVLVSTLTALKGGHFCDKVDDVLREVTAAVLKTGVKGSITLKLTIAANGVGVGDTPLLKIQPKISKVIPEMPETSQSFFADEDNNLTRRMPGQGEMKLEVVSNNVAAPALAQAKAVSGQ